MKNILIGAFITLIIGCKSTDDKIYNYVVNKYTPEELNFFYELCFNEKDTLYKWDKDILLHIEGDTLRGDKAMILQVAASINSLKLPIKIKNATNKARCNLVIRPYKKKGLVEENAGRGFTRIYNSNSRIDSAKMGISNTLYGSERKIVFLHEFFHLMGFVSHVTTDSKCILFSFRETPDPMSEKEKKALTLLYEPFWNKLFLKKNFEKIFTSRLYNLNRKEKMLDFIRAKKINKDILQEILEHGLIQFDSMKESQVVKHITPLNIILKGNVPPVAREDLQIIVKELNSATPNLMLKISDNATLQYGIFLTFVSQDTLPKDHILINYKNIVVEKAVFPTIIRSDVSIRYNKDYNRFKFSLGPVMYQIISLKDYEYMVEPFEMIGKELRLKPLYKDLLRVYYTPEFSHNLSKKELEQGIKEHY